MKKFVNGGGKKPYKIRKSKYIILIFLMILGFSSIYFSTSYGLFKKKQDLTRIDFVAGSLNYSLTSDKLTNNKITVNKNETVSFNIEIKSLNEIDSKYELYYLVNGEKTTNENIIVGYSSSTENDVSGTIKVNETKNISVNINNKTDEEIEITFGVEGGLINNELALTKGNQLALYNTCEYEPGYIWEFDYNGTNGSDGSTQEFVTPCDGIYKLETWGAQGGGVDNMSTGGYGAYSVGTIVLKKEDNVFINIGGKGASNCSGLCDGGYNGGGYGQGADSINLAGSGGGATHIATVPGLLSSLSDNQFKILIVSGGGGGIGSSPSACSTCDKASGGNAGGIFGNDGIDNWGLIVKGDLTLGFSGTGGNQTLGGFAKTSGTITQYGYGNFGTGGNVYSECCGGNGGGSGWFGGGGSARVHGGAGGGSSYIGNALLSNKSMYCHNCTTSSKESTKTVSSDCHSFTPTPNCAKGGNGYAKITYVGQQDKTYETFIFKYNGTNGSDGITQEFAVPHDGVYKLEAWGAQGGNINSYIGGYGGYSNGYITLKKDEKIYINVGGSPTTISGGYNGGGSISDGQFSLGRAGGGATNVSLKKDLLKDTSINDIFIVAAGGGGANNRNEGFGDGNGGSGGGYIGVNGISINHTNNYGYGYGTGATQEAGGGLIWPLSQNNPFYPNSGYGTAQTIYSGTLQSGGGGGLYGGGNSAHGGAGGGSSYIGSPLLTNKSMYCYNCTTSNEESTKTVSTDCHSLNPTTNCAKEGNGYARITYIGD